MVESIVLSWLYWISGAIKHHGVEVSRQNGIQGRYKGWKYEFLCPVHKENILSYGFGWGD